MVNWTEIEAIANSCLVLTSASAIGYAGLQLKHERQYRSVANLEKQLGFFQSEGFVATRRRLALDRLSEDGQSLRTWELEEPPVSAFEVLDFYEHVGLLVRKGHLDVDDVWHTFYEWAQPVYVDLQSVIESEESAYSDHYSHLRALMRQMDDIQLKQMHENNANHWALWTPERILEHYRYETEVAGKSGRGKRSAERRAQRAAARRAEEARVDLDAAALAVLDGEATVADEAKLRQSVERRREQDRQEQETHHA